MIRTILWGLVILAWPSAAAQPLEQRAFEHFYNLEYDRAIQEFERAIAREPRNPNPHNHLAQALLYREMYRDGALESELVSGANSFLRRSKLNAPPEIEKQFQAEIETAIHLAGERLERNSRDTAALYALGVSYGLRANYNFLVRKAWREALRDATTSRKLDGQLTELDPSNYDARLVQGVHDYVVGSLPWTWKLLGFLGGFRGDKERGLGTLEEVAQKGRYNRVDAEILLCALYRREGRARQALPLLDDLLRRFPRNHLLRFEQAEMYSATGDKEKAIASIETIAAMKQARAPGFADVPWEKIEFHMGTVRFWYGDYDRALENFKKVTAGQSRLDLNTGVLAWMRMGQIYDLTSRRSEAIDAYKHAIHFAPQADAAKESRGYLSTPYRREKV